MGWNQSLSRSLAESALLAGLIRNPGGYNPFAHAERSLARREQVLAAMARLGLASEREIAAARVERLSLASGSGGFVSASYAVDFVRSQLAELYSADILAREGLQIFTTIDTRWQEAVEQALSEGLNRLEREVPLVSLRSIVRTSAPQPFQGRNKWWSTSNSESTRPTRKSARSSRLCGFR